MGFENDSGYTITSLRSLTQQHSSSVAQVPFSLNNKSPGVLRDRDSLGGSFFGKDMPRYTSPLTLEFCAKFDVRPSAEADPWTK